MTGSELPDYAIHNRAHWTGINARYSDKMARAGWASDVITWGVWGRSEAEIQALPEYRGRDVIELGCGTAYFAAWLKRAGARRVVGIDVTPAQLDTARRMEAEFHLGIELIEGNAEAVPLPDGSFDLALSEYGASIWCDPNKWIPEAARLLRPGGDLVFLRNSTVAVLCSPDVGPVGEQLLRPQKGLGRVDWEDDGEPTTEFHIASGEMIRLLRATGFEVLDRIDVYASATSSDHPFYSHISADWARKWPSEEIWRARRH